MSDNNYNEENLPREKTDLFLENNMDEMLRYKNYELGYKIFRNYFTAVYVISIIIAVVGGLLKNIPLAAVGIFLTLFTAIFRIFYAAKAASQGIMNPTYVSRMTDLGKIWIYYLVSAVVYAICAFASGRHHAVFYIIAIIASATNVLEYYFAKKNMKILEKMLSEGSENEE
ncbi:MAG: hypothetical protein K2N71_00375 [Oscillospiraceae bacterium]|nr:hypothetical protein [Oscillospiraceae bacterium]